ncbi:VOC family protein [Pseudoalteromonas sp. CNC9-20]|uniref:VOC family protein n=1 Tax=Pseudoalteromonas sp. CNC9-20 TaxID=2917750 RepID=UPI001EF4E71B|nr:VOC family protein [Pseudoalteromonas sp. CNC9-20]MCG7571449.1 VOC family protein [Pseudoalteromonas sp. CNC9-20]
MSVSAKPKGFHSLTAYLIIDGAAKAMAFYQHVFAAEIVMQMPLPDGGIAHGELKIGDSYLMVADACPDEHFVSPHQLGGTPVSMMLYVEDVDTTFARAIDVGAKELRPVHDQFYGDRAGTLEDPFGHIWTIATHQEDLSPEQLQQRMADFMSEQQDA